jgi:uncharacterized protein YcsI (UPF0317 family)
LIVTDRPGEVPVFWACGVPPGHVFVADVESTSLLD